MKSLKLILACLLLSSYFNESYSQEYIPFFVDNVKWTMERTHPVPGQGDGHSFWEIYTLNDTLINNKIYRKVATKNLCRKWPDMQGNLHYDYSIVTKEYIFGGIREENKKIYLLRFTPYPQWSLFQQNIPPFNLEEEHLLYDFDVTPGDTIHFTGNYFTIIIDQIASSQNYKSYEVTNSSAYYFPFETGTLQEGLGSSYGFFGSYDSYLTDLICYTINDHNCAPCTGFVSTDNIDVSGNLKIYPNPANDILNVISESDFLIEEIKITDSTGKLLGVRKFSNHTIQLDLSGFPAGIIFLHIILRTGFNQVQKVVISHQ
ncbi:MAG TPA: T9SS type A sorting domain-containing protein [Saprospiraceae bacterium]|nr:T9SS type A sorting domain-containing protein [Saprospiraceae bacterium]